MSPLRPRCLVVLSSSNQLYSGTGTALFNWISFAKHAIDFSILIDTYELRNADIAARFCKKEGLRFIPSASNPMPGCPDHGVREIARVFLSESWDIIECVSWANASTNLDVLSSIGPTTKLIYTPHTQPLWTLTDEHYYFMVQSIFEKMLRRADCIFVDSNNELDEFALSVGIRDRAFHVPLGVDIETFHPGAASTKRQVLSVCDFAEPRKRVDLLLRAYSMAADIDPTIELMLAGSRSAAVVVPDRDKGRVKRLGFVKLDELVRLYQHCGVFVLLSDFEAFGLPIVESLCCGAPVVINRQPVVEGLFGGLPGVTLVDNQDTPAVAQSILEAMNTRLSQSEIAAAAMARFSFTATYGRKLERTLALLNSVRD